MRWRVRRRASSPSSLPRVVEVLENPEAFSLTPAGRPQAIGPPQDDQERRRRTLASVASARLSAAAADSYWDTWPDVESNAGELLREYVSAPKALWPGLDKGGDS